MNKYFILAVCSLLLLSTPIYASNTAVTANKPIEMKHVVGVHGLSCPFCVIGVKKTLVKMKGVKSVEVSLKHKTVTIYTNKGVCFSDKELKKIFANAGFSYHGTILRPEGCKKGS